MASGNADSTTSVESSAQQHVDNGDFDKAESAYRELVDVRTKSEGPEGAIRESYSLGGILLKQRKYAEAETILRQVMKALEERPNGRETGSFIEQEAGTASGLSEALRGQGKINEANDMADKASTLREKASQVAA